MLGDEARSKAELREALEANPLMASPDSLSFPPPLVALFLQVRDEVQSLIARREAEEVERLRAAGRKARAEEQARLARERSLRELAEQETLVTSNSRVVAFLPFGAGQYQNGHKALGDFFLVTETGVGVMAGVSGLILLDLYRQAAQVAPAANDNSKFQAAYTVFAVSSWTFVGLAVLGALEANLSYKELRVLGVRKRASTLSDPARSSEGLSARGFELLPFGGPVPSGAFFGVTGRF
jgi:hypothetical protein